MNKTSRNALILTGGLLLIAITANKSNYLGKLKTFLPSVEGFSSKPMWDVQQWSWGYGSKVPGSINDPNKYPGGTITRERAWTEALRYITTHYSYLKPLISAPLNNNQIAALLSFSYNLGQYNADNIIPEINSRNQDAVFANMRQYVYADGVRNQGLVNRREKEIALWKGSSIAGMGAALTWQDHLPFGTRITAGLA